MKTEKGQSVCLKPINCLLSNKSISREYGVELSIYNIFMSKQLIVYDTILSEGMDYTNLKRKDTSGNIWFLNEAVDTNTKFK